MADRIGKSRATIYRYENGDIESLPTTILEPLAKALNTTPADLMGWGDADQKAEAMVDYHIELGDSNFIIEVQKLNKENNIKRLEHYQNIINNLRNLSDDDLDMLESMEKRFAESNKKDDN